MSRLIATTYTSKGSKLTAGFKRLDMDHDGCLSWDEFRRVIRKQGVKLTDDDVQQLFLLMDSNGSGSIEFDDFKTFMRAQIKVRRTQRKSPSPRSKIKVHRPAPTRASQPPLPPGQRALLPRRDPALGGEDDSADREWRFETPLPRDEATRECRRCWTAYFDQLRSGDPAPPLHPATLLRLLGKLNAKAYTSKGPDLAVGFHRLDADRDGVLNWPEFRRVMRKQGVKVSSDGIKVLFELMDANRSGQIELSDFLLFMQSLARHRDMMEHIVRPRRRDRVERSAEARAKADQASKIAARRRREQASSRSPTQIVLQRFLDLSDDLVGKTAAPGTGRRSRTHSWGSSPDTGRSAGSSGDDSNISSASSGGSSPMAGAGVAVERSLGSPSDSSDCDSSDGGDDEWAAEHREADDELLNYYDGRLQVPSGVLKARTFQRLLNKLTASTYTSRGRDPAVGFHRLDADHDGKLSWTEFSRVMKKQGVKIDDEAVSRIFSMMDMNHSGSVELEDFTQFMDAHWNNRRKAQARLAVAPQRRMRRDRLRQYYNKHLPIYELMPRSTGEQRRLRTVKGRELRAVAAAADAATLRFGITAAKPHSSRGAFTIGHGGRGGRGAQRGYSQGTIGALDDPEATSEQLWAYYHEQMPIYGLMPTSTEEERKLRVTFLSRCVCIAVVINGVEGVFMLCADIFGVIVSGCKSERTQTSGCRC